MSTLKKGTIYSRRYMRESVTIMLGGQSLAYKALRQGYFLPTMKVDAINFEGSVTSARDSLAFPDHTQRGSL